MRMARPANMQKDCKDIIEEEDPKKKATALVKEVIVMEGPAKEEAKYTRECLLSQRL